MSKVVLKVRLLPDEQLRTLKGREAWAMGRLAKAGTRGCSPIDTPGPRWSHYVFKLRGAGFSIETIHEPHGGAFPGTHARYVLRSDVELVDMPKEDA